MSQGFPRLKRGYWVGLIALLAVLGFGLSSVVRARSDDSRLRGSTGPVVAAAEGPLVIGVSVTGTIKARELEILKSEVEGMTTVLWIIPEGTRVEAGELLVQLDSSRLDDSKIDQEIRVQNAEASYIGAQEQLGVTENQAQSDVERADLAYKFAQEDLNNYVNGQFPKDKKTAESRITLAQGTLERAQDTLEGSRRLAEKEFITANQLTADEQSALKAQLDLELALGDLALLTDFTYKRQVDQLESDVRQSEMALERARSKARADVVQAKASLKAKESEFNRQKSKLAKNVGQIEKTEVRAPRAGLVVYATTGRGGGFHRGNEEPLQEGSSVRERQELIHLPTASLFKAEVSVHETSLAKVRTGLPVRIAVDALPDSTFLGRVTSVAPLPDAQSSWMNPDLKVYNTDIDIDGDVEGLRTGMSCHGEIIVETHENALYIPVQAVVQSNGEPAVYLADASTLTPHKVSIGLDNNRMIHILDGITVGDRVLLDPPLVQDEQAISAADKAAIELYGTMGAAAPTPSPAQSPAAQADTGRGGPPRERGEAGERPRSGGRGEGRGGRGARGEGRGGGNREERRQRFENASPEEREKMMEQFRQRMENMSDEEREAMRQRFQRGGGGGRGRGGEGWGGGGKGGGQGGGGWGGGG